MSEVNLSYIDAKSGLSRSMFPEPFLISLYRSLAPYRGCTHACLYCDGRAEKYYVEGDFEKDIVVRKNLIELVERDIESGFTSREYGALCFGSGVTDAYQPIEEKLKITRGLLEKLVRTKLPIVILTKNELVLRDFDILSEFPQVLIIQTITTFDEELSAFLEPGASSPELRLNVIKQAKNKGFKAGVLTMPLCPGLTDQYSSIEKMFNKIKEAGADFICPGGLTLRPGCQKNIFMEKLDISFPSLIPLYNQIYKENRLSGMPVSSYIKPVYAVFHKMLSELNIPYMIPYSIYKNFLSPPDSIYILLCHMQELYSNKNIDTMRLEKAFGKYSTWLKWTRSKLRKKRKFENNNINFRITAALEENLRETGFYSIIENDKLSALLDKLLKSSSDFDYLTLKLTEELI